jgi:hypothetical protein
MDDAAVQVQAEKRQQILISPPNFQTLEVVIIGTAPYCQNRMSVKTQEQMKKKHEEGQQAKKRTAKGSKDFKALYEEAQYRLPPDDKGDTAGMPASAFRAGMISACRIVSFKMTLAKMAIFIEADGYDVEDGTPLVRIAAAAPPVMRVHPVRNATGVPDLRPRPFWDQWQATLRIRFDADMFTAQDVINLLSRVGVQVGIGEGRPDSKESAGMGWGTFMIQPTLQ